MDDDRVDGFPRAIGRPARGALLHAGYTTLEDLSGVSGAELLALHGVGPRAVRVIRDALAERGESLRLDP
jgi:hypothetical protein